MFEQLLPYLALVLSLVKGVVNTHTAILAVESSSCWGADICLTTGQILKTSDLERASPDIIKQESSGCLVDASDLLSTHHKPLLVHVGVSVGTSELHRANQRRCVVWLL